MVRVLRLGVEVLGELGETCFWNFLAEMAGLGRREREETRRDTIRLEA